MAPVCCLVATVGKDCCLHTLLAWSWGGPISCALHMSHNTCFCNTLAYLFLKFIVHMVRNRDCCHCISLRELKAWLQWIWLSRYIDLVFQETRRGLRPMLALPEPPSHTTFSLPKALGSTPWHLQLTASQIVALGKTSGTSGPNGSVLINSERSTSTYFVQKNDMYLWPDYAGVKCDGSNGLYLIFFSALWLTLLF